MTQSKFSKINLYIGTVDEAYDCVCLLRLIQCELFPEPLWAYHFPGNNTLIAFVLAYGTDVWVEGNALIVPDSRKSDADEAIQRLTIQGVQTTEVFAVEVWDEGDEAVFDAIFG